MPALPTLEGSRLRLRPLAPRDADAILRLYGDRVANRFGYQPKMDDLDDARALVARTTELADQGTVLHWGVARREDDFVVGHATLFAFEARGARAEVGYSIEKSCWGRGFGTEAVGILVRHAFEDRDLRRLEGDVDPRNVASLRLLERLGFVREGYLRERWVMPTPDGAGDIQDSVMFGLLRREWDARRARPDLA
jgi:RimJ/RimL family protein N-acetyltransferase